MDARRVAGYIIIALTALQLLLVGGLAAGAEVPVGYGLVILVAELAVLYAVYRIARRLIVREPMPVTIEPRPDRRPPVAPVPVSELVDVPEPINACPDCGYLGVRMPELRDGLWPGGGELGSRVVCPRCGYQGLAVRFDTRGEYAAWLRDLDADRRAEASA